MALTLRPILLLPFKLKAKKKRLLPTRETDAIVLLDRRVVFSREDLSAPRCLLKRWHAIVPRRNH